MHYITPKSGDFGLLYGLDAWEGNAVTVMVAVAVAEGSAGVAVAVGVGVPVGVAVGTSVAVGRSVAVGASVAVRVRVGKMIEIGVSVAVAVARGARVATFGTQISCPLERPVWLADMQLANWSWEMLTPYAWLRLNMVLPGCTL
jgi:hypothetical protein